MPGLDEGSHPSDRPRAADPLAARTIDWKVTPWDLVVTAKPPSLLLVGDLEDEEHLMTEVAAEMKDATEIRFEGVGHIKAFLASDRVLPHVEAFLAKHFAKRLP